MNLRLVIPILLVSLSLSYVLLIYFSNNNRAGNPQSIKLLQETFHNEKREIYHIIAYQEKKIQALTSQLSEVLSKSNNITSSSASIDIINNYKKYTILSQPAGQKQLLTPKKFLSIVIMTRTRPNDEFYLKTTLDSLFLQMDDHSDVSMSPFDIDIHIINHDRDATRKSSMLGNHLADLQLHLKKTQKAKENKHDGLKKKVYFAQNTGVDDEKFKPQNQFETQIVDVHWTLQYILENISTRMVLLLEDDFEICPNSLLAILYVIQKVTRWNSHWLAIRVSYGLNGIIMKLGARADVQRLKLWLADHIHTRQPVDHLFYQFCLHEANQVDNKRQLFTYRSNLFHHIGSVSNFQGRRGRYNPPCHQVSYDWLQNYERFRNEDCPHEDISPCKMFDGSHPPERLLVDFDVTAKDLCRLHFPLCDPAVKDLEESKQKHCRSRTA